MYRGFLLNGKIKEEQSYSKKYDELYFSEMHNISESCRYLVNGKHIIDGEALSKDWFPISDNFQIFISHSHADIQLAKALASLITMETGLKCFIDSEMWGNFRDLEEDLSYDFESCEEKARLSEHMHIMLNVALMEMMNKCEVLFFLNTPNSLSIDDITKGKTISPWIFSEIEMFNRIEKREPDYIRRSLVESVNFILQNVDLQNLTRLTAAQFDNWLDNHDEEHPLISLYEYCF